MGGSPPLQVPAGPLFCGATWFLGSQYVFSGPLAGEAQVGFDELAAVDPAFEAVVDEAADVWDLVYSNAIEFIFPLPWEGIAPDTTGRPIAQARPRTNRSGASMWSDTADGMPLDRRQRMAYKPGPRGGAVEHVGGVPSVSVSREVVSSGTFGEVLKATADLCASGDEAGCSRHELYHDITGNVGSPQPANTSVGPDFREAIYHVVVGQQSLERMEGIYYPLGRNSYLSESAYYMSPGSFGPRYWGEENYAELLEVKARHDPSSVFWCHHCVGDTEEAAHLG